MKFILFFAVLLARFLTTFSSTAVLYSNSCELFRFCSKMFVGLLIYLRILAHKGLCVVDDIHPKIILKPGESQKLPPCGKISCKKSGVALIIGCSIEAPPQDCYFDGYANLEAPFPYCCAKRLFC
uniref:SVWC domain-containing protein n=1 Tax=Glossina austeni TaxID=7395 RepID=A0A1A9UN34_GLOAU